MPRKPDRKSGKSTGGRGTRGREETTFFASTGGDAIRRAREELGLSRKQLAELADLSYSYLSEIENGAKIPSSKAYRDIAQALSMRPSQLLARSEESLETGLKPQLRFLGSVGPVGRAGSARPLKQLRSLGSDHPSEERWIEDATPALSKRRHWFRRAEPALPPTEGGLGRQALPDSLVQAIERGDCVAFVGPGFSGAAYTPGWGSLLERLAAGSGVSAEVRSHVATRIAQGSAHAFDEAAQLLEDQLGRRALLQQLHAALGNPPLTETMEQRVAWLRGIPFRSILTTSIDGILPGSVPSNDSYREALRSFEHHWWSENYWSNGHGAFTLKLHGDLAHIGGDRDSVILTRRDYRRRLYEDPAYRTFLLSIMATRTILYMGFSFEDAYLNEFRSEVLTLLGRRRDSSFPSYAIASDVPEETQNHFRLEEGIEMLSYDSHGGNDHSGFDDTLAAIYRETTPLLRFARHLERKRILWVDPHPENNELAFEHLEDAARMSGREGTALVTVATAAEGLSELRARGKPFDLAITHWGEDAARDDSGVPIPTAVRLLTGIREQDTRCPVVVFASRRDASSRKRTALGLGAQAYCFHFDRLYEAIERILAPGNQTG